MPAEVAAAYVSLMPTFKGGQAAISRELAGATGKAGATAGAATGKRFGGTFLPALKGLAGPVAAVFAGTAVLDFFKDGVVAASDLNETVSKTKVVFGPAAQAVLDFSKNATTGLGQTREQALAASATFGTFGKSAGLAGPDLSKFSTQMVTLATDMASFSNTSPEQAIEALGAALRGEAEPIRAYGVLLDDASLRQEAVRQGIAKTTKDALTPQQKVLAAHSLILKQTGDAQGDFARTSGGLANQQRILTAQWQDAKATIGQALLPVITSIVSKFNEWLPSIVKIGKQVTSFLGPAIKTAIGFIGDLIAGLSGDGAGGIGSGFLSFLSSLKSAFDTVAPVVGRFVQALLPPLQKIGRQIAAVVGPALRDFGQIIKTQVAPALAAFLPAVRPIAAFLIGVIGGAVVGALKGAVNVIRGVFQILAGLLNVFAGLFTGDWDRLWKGVQQIGKGVWDAIKGAFQIFINVGIGKAFSLGAKVIGKIGSKLWSGLTGIFKRGAKAVEDTNRALIDAVVGFFRSLPGKAGRALASLGRAILRPHVQAFNSARQAVSSGISRVLSLVRDVPGRASRALSNIGNALRGAGRRLIQGLIDGIREMIGRVKDAVGSVMDAASRLIPRSPAKEGPFSGKGWTRYSGRAIVDDLARGIRERGSGVHNALAGALTSPALAGVGLAGGSSLIGGDTHVYVSIDGEPIRAVVRTEVGETNRGIRRRASAGAGGWR